MISRIYTNEMIEITSLVDECLHGVARAGVATIFLQAIALSATFDPEFIRILAETISDEARIKYHQAIKNGNRIQYHGLTFWTPNINIFRDPRWGVDKRPTGKTFISLLFWEQLLLKGFRVMIQII